MGVTSTKCIRNLNHVVSGTESKDGVSHGCNREGSTCLQHGLGCLVFTCLFCSVRGQIHGLPQQGSALPLSHPWGKDLKRVNQSWGRKMVCQLEEAEYKGRGMFGSSSIQYISKYTRELIQNMLAVLLLWRLSRVLFYVLLMSCLLEITSLLINYFIV